VIGLVGPSYDGAYSTVTVDPATGEVVDTSEIAGTQHADELEAAALPDGVVVVAGDRSDGPPFLLLLDPVHGTPRPAARIDVSAVAGAGDLVQVDGLAVSPDGSWVAVALTVRADGSSEATRAVAVVESDLADLAARADTVGLEGPPVSALAVDSDGVAYVAQEGARGISAVDAAAGTVREVPADLGEITELAVVGDALVTVDRGLEVDRLDPATGRVTGSADLCTDTGAASGIGVAPDGSLVVVANCAGAGLWVVPV
jgi:DNA-binding beta-propeller fold protein YncE